MQKEIILGERTKKVAGAPFGPYSHGVKVKGSQTLIFIAGQGAYVNGKLIGKADVGAQYRQIMKNMKAILEDAGASMSSIVKMVHYMGPEVTPGSKEYAAISEIRRSYIPEDFPVSTMVQVAGFMVEGMLVEVDAIAVLD